MTKHLNQSQLQSLSQPQAPAPSTVSYAQPQQLPNQDASPADEDELDAADDPDEDPLDQEPLDPIEEPAPTGDEPSSDLPDALKA